ncbi:MAG: glycosyltransferase family 39 protein [Bdellovibrionota bacterium]
MFEMIESEWWRNCAYLSLTTLLFASGIAFGSRLKTEPDSEVSPIGSRQVDPYLVMLVLALLVSASLRFYGIGWGLPRAFHPDEFEEARFLRNMMRNDSINPNYTQQPPLILYLAWPISAALNFFGMFDGDTLARNVLGGRIVNAIAAILSVFLVSALGKRLFSRFSGALAALILATSPLHVTNSRYMKQDSLLVMFVIGCALCVVKCVDTKKFRYLYLAGALAGLAAGSKYSGFACVAIVLSAPWLNREKFSLIPNRELLVHAVLASFVMGATFLLSMPYVLMSAENFRHLLSGMAFESKHAQIGHHGLAIDPWNQLWMFHLSRSLLPGVQTLPLLAAIVAAGTMVRRGETRGMWAVALFLLFYLPAEWARSKPPPQPDRYVLACIPFLALLAADFCSRLRTVSDLGRMSVAALLVLFPLARSVALASEVPYDTREQMTDWLSDNLPKGTKLLVTGGSAYLPRIPHRLRAVSARKVITRDKSRMVEALRSSEYDYLITTSISTGRFSVQNLPSGNERPLAVRNAMTAINRSFPVVKRIAPRFGSYGFHNPTITIYSLKEPPQGQTESAEATVTPRGDG